MAEHRWWIRRVFRAVAFVLLLSDVPVRAQDATGNRGTTSQALYRISGTVVSSLDDKPLGNARVTLTETTNRVQAIWVITSEDGRFEFNSIPAGKFSLEGAKRGFMGAGYQQHEQFSTAIVTEAGFNTENLVLRLTPWALLAGKVIDESGDPVRNAQLRLFVESPQEGSNRIVGVEYAATDDLGSYEFADLAPGNYYVSVVAKPWYAVHGSSTYADGAGNPQPSVASSLDVAYPTTFYNGATDSDGAAPIVIHGGDRVQADIHLNPVPALHLFIRVPTDAPQGFRTPFIQQRVFDSTESVRTEGMGFVSPGVMEMVGIPPGKYSVSGVPGPDGRGESSEMNLTKNGQELEAPSSEALSTVKVSVKMARGEPLPKELNLALRNSRRQVVGFIPIEASGEATFEDVPPGKYAVLVNSAPPLHTIARISSQGVVREGHDIDVGVGASMDLSASIVTGVVKVEGFAKRAGQPMSGVMVGLVPRNPEAYPERVRRDQSDMDGSFTFRGVLPGSYTLIAVEDAWDFPWMQPGTLEKYVQHGQNITVGELMNGAVELPDPIEVQPR
jgi:uncharacterized protein (DUF2141 family)